MKPDALYLIDSYALIYRSYFAFQSRPLKNPSGMNVSAVFGFFRSLFALMDTRDPKALACVFDSRVPTFRHELYAEYKATRQKTPEDLHAQVPLVEEILAALGIPLLRADGFEADDLIATLADRSRAEGRECYILSGDKDLLQLVDDTVKAIKSDKAGGFKVLGRDEVREEWGIWPEQILDYLSLTGDSSDNVPGVMGIGDKTASALVNSLGTLDSIYARLGEVVSASQRKKLEEGRESAYFSRKLIELRRDAPIGFAGLDALHIPRIDKAAGAAIFKREGMKSLADQLSKGSGELFELDGSPNLFGAPTREAPGSPNARAKPAAISAEATGVSDAAAQLPPLEEGYAYKAYEKGDYQVVTSVEALNDWIARAKHAGSFAFDCETDSLDAYNARPVGFSLSFEEGRACYVPIVAPPSGGMSGLLPAPLIKDKLRELLENPDLVIAGHNIKYDLAVMQNWGIKIAGKLFDTMIAAWLLDAERMSYSLEATSELWLRYKGIEFSDVVPKGDTFDKQSLDKAGPYAAEDADVTFRLYNMLSRELKTAGLYSLFIDLEMPLVPLLADMERVGIAIKGEVLSEFGIELVKRLAEIEKDIYKLVGHEFNINSPKQLQEVLFVERKLKTGKKTKTGYSTDVSVLEELAQDDPVPELILKNRTLAKLKGTYVDALPLAVGSDGRIHTQFSQTGTATGRLSSHNPNLQNIPIREEEGRRIRAAFVAPAGSLLVSADYSQIELVVLAHLSKDPELLRAFASGIDVHKRTASLVFGVPEEMVTQDMRRAAKTINFGVIYGMSAFRLAGELKIPRGEAQSFIDAYFRTYSGVKEFIDKTIADCERRGYVSTLMGRRRKIDHINSSNRNEKSSAERVAVNTPIQGSAADIVKTAMLRVCKALKAEGLRSRVVLQVHDELILESPEIEVAAASELVKREMEAAVTLDLPLRASVESAKSWGDLH